MRGLSSGFAACGLRFALIAISLLVAGIAPAFAQTSSFSLGWDQPVTGTQTIADVNAFLYTVKVNTGTAVQAVQTCVAGTPIKCTTPLPSVKSGDVVTLTVTNGFGSGSASVTAPGGASAPVNVTVIVKVTIP